MASSISKRTRSSDSRSCILTQAQHDFAGRLTSPTGDSRPHTGPSGSLAAWDYTRTPNGYLASADPGGLCHPDSETYDYTALDQLVDVDEWTYYSYDAADNLLEQVLFNRTFDEANQITGQAIFLAPPTTYDHDEHGNRSVVGAGTPTMREHHYDQANRLVDVTGAVNVSYTYNGDGLRTTKTTAMTTLEFTWDLASPLPMLLSDTERDYIYGPEGHPLAHVDTSEAVTWYGHDQQGSTRLLTDDAGTQVAAYRYEAYGILLSQTGTVSTPLRYTGEYTDTDTSYQYLRARYYDPYTGQFLTRDPLEARTREPYGYVGGNPLNYTDPDGALPLPLAIGVGIAIGAAFDLGIQALTNTAKGCSPLDNINARSIALSGAIGGVGGGIGHLAKAARAAQATRTAPSLTTKAPQVLRVGDVKLSAVPKGAVGTPTQPGKGLQYAIKSGTPELHPRVTHIRIMGPMTTGKYQYPHGYAVYMNRSGQTVNPLTGETISNSHPFSHIPL